MTYPALDQFDEFDILEFAENGFIWSFSAKNGIWEFELFLPSPVFGDGVSEGSSLFWLSDDLMKI